MSLFLELNLPHTITNVCVQVHGVENAHRELEQALQELIENKTEEIRKERDELIIMLDNILKAKEDYRRAEDNAARYLIDNKCLRHIGF